MQRNTITTLAQLRKGDRFTFTGKEEVWQKTGCYGSNVTYNKFTDGGIAILKYDEKKADKTSCRFVRHTVPLPGEDCLVQDLKQGDVFFMNDNIVVEYQVTNVFYEGRTVKAFQQPYDSAEVHISFGTRVVCVSKQEEVKA